MTASRDGKLSLRVIAREISTVYRHHWTFLVPAAIAVIGFVLLVVPGLVFMTYSSISPAVLKIEHLGVVGAPRRSIGLVRGRARRVFVVVVGTVLLTELAVQAVTAPFHGVAPLTAVNLIAQGILQPIEGLAIALVAIHLLELHGEAPAPDALARALVGEPD